MQGTNEHRIPPTSRVAVQLLGASPAIAAVRDQVARLIGRQASPARRLPPVLIDGETGTGKGLLAQMIHEAGPRAGAPFVDVNCAAIPDTLLEAELFGFERGAFTDARQAKPGLLQLAHRGTVFLDEIGLMPDALQVKLLKAIEDRAVRRLGGTRSEAADAWVLAATSEDLQSAIRARRFREDLYHRLAVVALRLPPLRDRGGDILLLARHYLARACADYGVRLKTLTAEAEAALLAYSWPGNVRELANVMERVALLADEEQVSAAILALGPERPARAVAVEPDAAVDEEMAALERRRIEDALRECGGNISHAAIQLGLPRNTLRYRMERHGLGGSAHAGRRRRTPDPEPARPAPDQPPPVRTAPDVQWRRTRVTVLDLLARDPDDMSRHELDRALERAAAKVLGFGGRILDLHAAGVVAAFGLDPLENAPRHAAHAALAILRGAREHWGAGPTPHIEIALHTADALVGRVADRVELHADARRDIDRAVAALRASAPGERVVVSAETRPFLARHVTLEAVTSADHSTPSLWRVTGLVDQMQPARPLVARARELELLESLLAQALDGRGQAVLLVGDPGIGKSRLLQELRQRTGDKAAWLEGHAVSFGRSLPFHPLIDLVKRACAIDDGDAEPVIAEKLDHVVARLGQQPPSAAGFLRALLAIDPDDAGIAAMDPKLRRAGMFEAVRHLLLALANARPLVVVLEDAHWMDEATTEFLALMAPSLTSSRMLLCVSQRAGFALPSAEAAFQTRLTLTRLSSSETASFAGTLLGDAVLSPDLVRLLEAKTDGNPFFVEEMVRCLHENGALDRRDTVGLAQPGGPVDVPDTVQAAIRARLDHLESPLRDLLQRASVIGREFSRKVLERIVDDDAAGAVDARLHALAAAELIRQGRVWPEVTYVFKHALTQEVAYQTQAEPQRQTLHARIADAMERVYADRLSEQSGVLAYHFTCAGRWAKALDYLLVAARQAEQSFATREALGLYDEAKTAAEQLAGGVAAASTLIAIHEARARLHFVRSDFEQSAAEAERILPLARLVGDRLKEGEALATIAWAKTWGRNLDAAIRFAHEALAVAEPVGASSVQGRAYFTIGFVRGVTGVLDESHAAIDRAMALSEAAGDPVHRSLALSTAGLLRNWTGDFEGAERLQNEGGRLARERGLLFPLLFSCFLRGLTLTGKGAYDEAFEAFGEGLAMAERVGDEAIHHRLLNCLGWLYAEVGDLDRAHELNTTSARIGRRRRDPGTQPNAELNLGDIALARGDLQTAQEHYDGVFRYRQNPSTSQWMRFRYSIRMFAGLGELALARRDVALARAHCAECLELATRSGSRKNLVKAWRLAGDIERASGAPHRAEEHLRKALGLAESVGNPVQCWRTDLALGHLLSDAARSDEARAAFARAYQRMLAVRERLRHEGLREAFERSADMRHVRELIAGV